MIKVAGALVTDERSDEMPRIGARDLAEASAAVRVFRSERARPCGPTWLRCLLT